MLSVAEDALEDAWLAEALKALEVLENCVALEAEEVPETLEARTVLEAVDGDGTWEVLGAWEALGTAVVEEATLVVEAAEDEASLVDAEVAEALVDVLVYVLPTYGAHTLGSLSFAGSFVRYPSFTPSR